MKETLITLFILTVFYSMSPAQEKANVAVEIGKWRFEQDMKSMWEFKADSILHKTYDGRDTKKIYTYTISTNPPICPDAQLSIEPNVKYLKTVDQKNGYTNCFYIYALNEKRLTVMDAVTGHIFPSVRVED